MSARALEVSERALEVSERTLAVSGRALAVSERALEVSERALAVSERALADSSAQLADSSVQLEDSSAQLEDSSAQLADSSAQLADSGAQLADSSAQLEDSGAQLEDSGAQLADSSAQLADSGPQLADSGPQLGDSSAQLEDPSAQLEDSSRQLADSSAQLAVRVAQHQKPKTENRQPQIQSGYTRARMRRAARELAIIAVYLVLAVLMTWPLAPNLSTAVSDLGDPLLNAWILDWVCYALTHQPLDLYDAPMFYPGKLPLAYSENLVAIGVLVLPFWLAGATPVALHGIATLLGFALSGYGAFVLARVVTRSFIPSFAAGLFFAFVGFKFDHLPHVQIVFSAWVPLLLAALLIYWRKPSLRHAVFFGAMWVLNGLTNVYFLLFLAATAIVTFAFFALIGDRRPLRFWLGLGATLVAAMLVLLPFLLPYRIVGKEYKMKRWPGEVAPGSAVWNDWLVASYANRLYGPVADDAKRNPERQLFPGMAIVILTLAAFVKRKHDGTHGTNGTDGTRAGPVRFPRALEVLIVLALVLAWLGAATDRFEWTIGSQRIMSMNSSDVPMVVAIVAAAIRFRETLRNLARRSRFTLEEQAAALWIVVGVLGSLGLNAFFYTFFYMRFGPFAAMRVPARWAIVAYAGLAVWGALGMRELLQRTQRRTLVAMLLTLVIAVDVLPRPIRWEQAIVEPAPVYRWLNKTRVGPVLELPVRAEAIEYQYLLGSTAHHVPIVNGSSGFEPPTHSLVRTAEHERRYDEVLRLVEESGTRLIVVHADWLGEGRGPVVEWLRANVASGRLAFLRRFDHDYSGDYVFAITRNLPRWQPLRAEEVPDGSGHLPAQNLERFFEGKTTYSHEILARVEEPRRDDVITGPLRVKGWALSPHGIRRVTVRVYAGRHKVDAPLQERGDVKQLYTWYYFTEKPGFEVVLPARPRWMPERTDVQVEIEDRAGRVMRTRDVLIEWK
ncbi:MAG TPA: hypothetical protein VF618_28765 [Thermoanaerobaculia bacterium]